MAPLVVQTLRSMCIGSRITLMTGVNALVAVLLLSLAWLGMNHMEQRLAEMERLREQNMRMETIAKQSLQLMLLARQYMDEGDPKTITQLAIYGPNLERSILAEAEKAPSLAEKTRQLLEKLQDFQVGFDKIYSLQKQLAAEYENLLELGENISSFIAIVNANARGENEYSLLPELEKANRWLHQAIAAVNRFYFSGEQYDQARNELDTLSIYLPAVADRAGNTLRSNYLHKAAELVEQYMQGLDRLAKAKEQRFQLAAQELNAPQDDIQETINSILRINSIKVQESTEALRRELERMTVLGLSILAGLLILSGLLSWAIGRSITHPLGILHQAVRDQAEGRPIRSLPAGKADDELAAMAGTVRKVISLQAEKDELIHELKQAQQEISRALNRLRNLLDNSGQGVVSFGPDLIVDKEYSRECFTLFNSEQIAGRKVNALLCPGDEAAQENLGRNLRRILLQHDPFRRSMLISLMPAEFRIHEITVEVQYRILDDENGSQPRMMLLLTDVSEARELQRAMQAEGRRLSLVVSAVKNRDELLDVLDDLQTFLEELDSPNRGSDLSPMDAQRAMRMLHTYKGLFSLMDCIHLPPALHEAETRLSTLPEEHTWQQLVQALDSPLLVQAIEQDLDVIRQTLGEGFLESRGEVVLPAETTAQLLQLAEALGRYIPPAASRDVAQGLETLRRLRHVDLRSMLERFPGMAVQIAERQEKELAPFAVQGDAVLVDPERLAPFVRSLVHVFRNAVDHGLETRLEREEAGKPPAGEMTCTVHATQEGAEIVITDDGRGLDLERLYAKARELGLELSAEEKANPALLVFAQGLSTAPLSGVESHRQEGDSVEDPPLSGRGVGMAAVKAELQRLQGSVAVSTEAGRGTRYVFHVPSDTAAQGSLIE